MLQSHTEKPPAWRVVLFHHRAISVSSILLAVRFLQVFVFRKCYRTLPHSSYSTSTSPNTVGLHFPGFRLRRRYFFSRAFLGCFPRFCSVFPSYKLCSLASAKWYAHEDDNDNSFRWLSCWSLIWQECCDGWTSSQQEPFILLSHG